MYAAESSSQEVLELLLQNGADPNIKDRNGKNALDYALNKALTHDYNNVSSDESD